MRDENIVQEEVLVKNLRTSITHEYTTRILQFINRPQFVKKQIEDRGIIVIDEIDKLVNEVRKYESICIIYIYIYIYIGERDSISCKRQRSAIRFASITGWDDDNNFSTTIRDRYIKHSICRIRGIRES